MVIDFWSVLGMVTVGLLLYVVAVALIVFIPVLVSTSFENWWANLIAVVIWLFSVIGYIMLILQIVAWAGEGK